MTPGQSAAAEVRLPYQDSLLSFLEMAPHKWTAPLAEITAGRDLFFTSGDSSAADLAMQKMDALASRRLYFRLPYLQWLSCNTSGKLRSERTEELRQLPERLTAYQKQARYFMEYILDLDLVGRETQKNTYANYIFDEPRDTGLFRFQPIPTGFEPVDGNTCGAVLWPNTIRDIIDFSLRDFVTRSTPVRRRKNCGRYFPLIARISAEYCERPTPSGKICRSTASALKWAEKRRDNKIYPNLTLCVRMDAMNNYLWHFMNI